MWEELPRLTSEGWMEEGEDAPGRQGAAALSAAASAAVDREAANVWRGRRPCLFVPCGEARFQKTERSSIRQRGRDSDGVTEGGDKFG
ncbi:hypothetical protein PR202_gb17754 [Eleusine coracana subsp. coracana]|uniref:Uncharacterized protein n=1 Tax=Eleusine coracana subsp. coracana TaxID=191504 RepID=A0AAV5F3Q3_ELECO|nr:hypothetical protein PR202_gb17754 [Eleusine coracana subsp. coracana]